MSVRGLTVAYPTSDGPVTAVRGVDLTVRPGQCVALVGESGSGKTTVGRALLGMTGGRVTADALTLDGADARAFDERRWRAVRGRFAGLVLQDALVSLDPLRTVAQEIGESLRALPERLRRAERRERVHRLLTGTGVPDPGLRARQHAHELSGGLRQRALIASAIAARPPLLVADEPTTALDVSVQRQVLTLLAGLKREGLGILLISHDLAVVAEIADHVLVMRAGEVVEEGAPDAVLTAPAAEYTARLVAAIPSPARTRTPRPALPANTAEQARPVLEGRGLTVRHTRRGSSFTALDGVDVTVREGRTLGVVGESGAGKSTLLRVLLGFQEPTEGTVTLDGEPWSGIPESARRARRPRLQIVSQDPLSSFDPRWTVGRIVGESLRRATATAAERRERVAALLTDVGLDPALAARHPLDLSGGQRQRVAIARALGADPEILFCDEAVSALDVLVQEQVLALLDRLRAERGISMVFVSHDLGVVRQVSDELIVLDNGRVVESGDAEEIYRDPRHPRTRRLFAALPRALKAAEAA